MCNLSFHQNIHPRFQAESLEQNKTIYFQIGKLAEKHGCSPAQLALGWILHQGDDVAPIPGKCLLFNVHSPSVSSVHLLPAAFQL